MPSTKTIHSDFELDENLHEILNLAIELAIKEDLGIDTNQDITTRAIVDDLNSATAVVKVKESAVIAGLKISELIFSRFSKEVKFEYLVNDGDEIQSTPKEVMRIEGPAQAILTGERLALNLLQRMSGVATITKSFVEKAKGTGIEVLDTRKTTPCLRPFDRIAVRIAGGTNHRSGLYDQFLIKDNHIKIAGSITEAIERARKAYPAKLIEIETRSIAEVEEAVAMRPDIILLDNMTPEMVKASLNIVDGKTRIEISGGITCETIDDYLIDGVDAISVGALTHSAKAIDISLDVIELN